MTNTDVGREPQAESAGGGAVSHHLQGAGAYGVRCYTELAEQWSVAVPRWSRDGGCSTARYRLSTPRPRCSE